jgi:hypothetical protein
MAAPTDEIIGDFVYSFDSANQSAGAMLWRYDGSSATVTIPNTVTLSGTEYDVTAIQGFTFHGKELTGVTIGDKVRSIANVAFQGNLLSGVVLPAGLTSAGAYAFYDNSLTSVTIPAGITSIADYAFLLNKLTSVTVPSGVTVISEGAFQQNYIASVTIPAGATAIGPGAFAGMVGNELQSVPLLGAAPTLGVRSFGDTGTTGPLVSFQPRFGATEVTGGYTTPLWLDYRARAVVPAEGAVLAANGVDPRAAGALALVLMLAGAGGLIARRRSTVI